MAGGMRAFLLVVISAIHCASAIAEQRTEEYEFDIPRSPIGSAITQIAQQTTGFSIGFLPRPDEKDVLVGPLQGRFTIADALTELFSGTEFEWETLGPGNIHVFRKTQEARSSRKAERAMPPIDSYARQTRPQSGTVVVLAPKLNVDAGRLPSVTVDTETIESHGVSTLAELLRYLPEVPFMRGADARVSGEQYTDFRGFGPGTTLVLINGRRIGPSATSFDTGAFDLNTIPVTAVKQLEISYDSRSAIGADAIGGVINIVLNDEIPEPVVRLKYGAALGGAEESRASAGFGITGNRFRGAVTLDAFQREFLFGSERDLTANQDFRRFGARDMRSLDAMPPNISSVDGNNLPGLAAPFAAVTPGGASLTDLRPGQRNLVSSNRYRSMLPKVTRASAIGTADFRVSDHASLFGEVIAVERENLLQIGPPAVRGAVIPATNPFNPFDEPVIVNALVNGVDDTSWVADTSFLRGVLGGAASFDVWTLEASVAWQGEEGNLYANDLDPAKVAQALTATDPDRALNFFRDGPPGSFELLRSLRAERGNDRLKSEYLNGRLVARGPVLNVAAGDVRLTFGAERWREGLSTPALGTKQMISSANFGELSIPLVAPSMKVRAAEAVDLSLGVRGDRNDSGTRTSARYALSWRPLARISLDLSYRDFFRAPNLYDLHLSRLTIGPIQFPEWGHSLPMDPFMGVIGGNPNLKPNSGYGWTAKLDYAPTDQTKLSASYWHASINQRIIYPSIPFVLSNEARFPGRVARMDATPEDLALGRAGRLVSVDVSPGNFGELDASGMDYSIQSSWQTRLGRIRPSIAATWYRTFRTTVSGLSHQRVGIGSAEGTIPRWRALASMNLDRGRWSFFSAVRYVSPYDDAFLDVRNGRSVETSLQVDARASVQLDAFTAHSALDGVKVSGGVINLLNAAPDYSEVFGSEGFDQTQADLRQRFWHLAIEKKF